ncbi:MAG: heavy metal translocating P-type ATPase [Eggerthellaceae bacterium]|nr:heavy metal translocating P-type ATPase [Eggerthellaceae bacterium]
MRYRIKHEVPGRIRFELGGKLPEHDATALEETLLGMACVTRAVAYPKAGSVAVAFAAADMVAARNAVIDRVAAITPADLKAWEPADSWALTPRPRHLFAQLANMAVAHFIRRALLPSPIRRVVNLYQALPFWRAALHSLRTGRLDVPVLDGAAIAMGFLRGTGSAGSTIFLLNVGEALEDFTQRRSEAGLARSLLDIPTRAHVERNGAEVEIDIAELHEGDVVVARLGDAIPVDGEVVSGEAAVNQSSLTGEPLAVVRSAGDTVFAGTAVEEGEVRIRVTGDPAASKVRSIVQMMEQSEACKSANQKRVESMADALVPWNFLLAGIVALTTRSLTKTAATLMVDYSCALRLSGSIAVMTAQRESAARGFMVKGSRYFEAMSEADVIVFDKTGTLTAATPRVAHVEPYDGYTREEVLRLAACLEEHFPHPVARAVVQAALDEGLEHRERHAAVEYVVAHGIASSLDGARVVIGSEHFVLEDEGVPVPADELACIHEQACGTSPLFLAVDGQLRGVIYVDDPLKPGVTDVVRQLHAEGFARVIMLTGDNERTAARIAAQAGIDEYRADLLPEDKHALVEELQRQGYKVAMVGDGVNDSPALAAARVSVAMSGGSAVAREAADITLTSDDLAAIVELRRLSRVLQKRLASGYRFTVAFNSALLALGIAGILTPQMSSALHNGSTVVLSASHARPFLPAGESEGR